MHVRSCCSMQHMHCDVLCSYIRLVIRFMADVSAGLFRYLLLYTIASASNASSR